MPKIGLVLGPKILISGFYKFLFRTTWILSFFSLITFKYTIEEYIKTISAFRSYRSFRAKIDLIHNIIMESKHLGKCAFETLMFDSVNLVLQLLSCLP